MRVAILAALIAVAESVRVAKVQKGLLGKGQEIDVCFDVINELAEKDRQLSQNFQDDGDDRVGSKMSNGAKGLNYKDWAHAVKSQKNNRGTIFSCGYSSSWVGEVLTGLKTQYVEYSNYAPDLVVAKEKNITKYPYSDVTGGRVTKLFNESKGSKDGKLFRFKHTGIIDHVWAVEQLPGGKGYRVYQSYNGAYSLKAWLAGNISDIKYGPDKFGYDAVAWSRVVAQFNQTIVSACHGLTIHNAENITAGTCPIFGAHAPAFSQWAVFARDYGEEQVLENLETSRALFGKGQILNETTFFDEYVRRLEFISEFLLNSTIDETMVWTNLSSNKWIELFASPAPQQWVGLPTMLIPSMFSLKGYHLEVVVADINRNKREKSCCEHGDDLLSAIPDETGKLESCKYMGKGTHFKIIF